MRRAAGRSHRPWPRAVGRRRLAATRSRCSWRRRADLLGLWGESGAVHMALLDEPGRDRRLSLDCPTAAIRRSGDASAGIRLERAIRDLFGLEPDGCPTRGPGSITALGRSPPLGGARKRGEPRRPTPSCRPRAKACTRSRSARCTPASSSPAISASPPTARRSCGSRSGSATSTRASRPDAGADLARAAKLAGRVSGDSTVAYALAFARAVEAALGIEAPPRAVIGCAR
jgi:hypothetical protein